MNFIRKKSHYELLQKRWKARHRKIQKGFWEKHSKVLSTITDNTKKIAVGSLSTFALATLPPSPALAPKPTPSPVEDLSGKKIDKRIFLITDLSNELPDSVRALSDVENDVVAQTLSRHFGVDVKAEVNGKRLNRTYGLIGQEQHLARYPGDSMDTHFDSAEDARKFYSYGMAPGLGAYGYFGSDAKGKLGEKWYIAVQTFLAPGYNQHTRDYNEFFKFRKMLLVNPQNGKAVVAVIGDAGPSEWTGKHLGGSPEVMNYLERFDGAQRGPVLYYFIDDPFDVVKLGPVGIQ